MKEAKKTNKHWQTRICEPQRHQLIARTRTIRRHQQLHFGFNVIRSDEPRDSDEQRRPRKSLQTYEILIMYGRTHTQKERERRERERQTHKQSFGPE